MFRYQLLYNKSNYFRILIGFSYDLLEGRRVDDVINIFGCFHIKQIDSPVTSEKLKTHDLKVHMLHYANELLIHIKLSSQKLLQTHLYMRKQYEKKCSGKE